jgi:ankyrin repeat protein
MKKIRFFPACILALLVVSCDLRPLPDYVSVVKFGNAVFKNDMDLVKEYIKKYRDICMFSLSGPGIEEAGIVGMAVSSGNIEMVKLMVEHKASVNATYKPGGFTALETAVQIQDMEIIKYLLDNGADPKNIDDYGNNIFHTLAYQFRNIDAVMLIGESMSNVQDYINMKTNQGYTPLTLLILEQLKDNSFNDDEGLKILELYLAYGADISSVIGTFDDSDLYTALISREANDYLKLLFSNTNKKLPDVNIYGDGWNYVMLCIYFDNIEMAPLFIPLVENINGRNEYGQTALHRAAFRDDENLFKILLEHGADKSIKDLDGDTAYDTYIKNHEQYNKRIIDLLR